VFWIVPTLYSKQSHDFFIVSSAAGHPPHSFILDPFAGAIKRAGATPMLPAKRHEARCSHADVTHKRNVAHRRYARKPPSRSGTERCQ
jgi:hypothetical protein